MAGLQVAEAVSDARYTRQIDVEAVADFLEQTRAGLTAVAIRLVAVWAEEHRVDAATDECQRLVHLVVYLVQRRHLEQSTADA